MSNPPLLSPLFQIAGNVLEYKPHADYPTWIPVWDLSGVIPVAAVYPECALLLPNMARVISGGFAVPTIQAGQHIGQYSLMRGLNTEVEFKIALGAGNYELSLAYVKVNSGGQLRLRVDGADVWNTLETYNATTQLAQIIAVNVPSTLSAGLHTINLKIPSKHVSSTNYDLLMSYLIIRKT